MKLFLIFANHGKEAAVVLRKLKAAGHEVVYWLGAPNEEVKNFPQIIFHHFKDARRGIPSPRIDAAKYPPPGASLIKELHGVETMVMHIINKNFPQLPFEEQKQMYYELLRYWPGVLKEFRPQAIVFAISPANSYNYLLFELAKRLGIKTIMFSDTWVSDRTLVHYDVWDAGPKLLQRLDANAGRNFSVDDLSPDLKNYYLKQTDRRDPEAAKPWYLTRSRKRYTGTLRLKERLMSLGSNLYSPKFFRQIYNFFATRLGQNLWKEYRRLQIIPDYSRKFVYIPLQYQPERTTTPLGGVFADLILMIETVAAALPQGFVIYVKEHPVQWWKHGRAYSPFRYRGYYEKIARIRNVFLVSIETDSDELIEYSQAVATVTGTSAWEAVLRRKPAVIFGYPWYRDCPFVFKVQDRDSCRQALQSIQNGYSISEQQVINFLKSLDEATIRCYIDDPLNTLKVVVSELSSEERLNNAANSIIQELHV